MKYVPDGMPRVIPRIAVDDPLGLVEFIKRVFGATGAFQAERPTELRLGDSIIMVASTVEREAVPAFLYVYVEDTDLVFSRAVASGATPIEEPRETPYGDRRAMIHDQWGNKWQIAAHGGQFKH